MSAICQMCNGKSDLFLCNEDLIKLRKNLTDLPWWIDVLTDSAIGNTRMSDPGGRGCNPQNGLRGDDEVLPKCTCGHAEHDGDRCTGVDWIETRTLEIGFADGEAVTIEHVESHQKPCLCAEYTPSLTQTQLRNQALRAGGVNAKASKLVDRIHNSLTTILRELCETRGITRIPPWFIGPLQPNEVRGPGRRDSDVAHWLAANAPAIAADEGAGITAREIAKHISDIVALVNRPPEMQTCGPCSAPDVKNPDTICATRLMAPVEAIEVRCPRCKTTHNVEKLRQKLFMEAGDWPFTIDELFDWVLPRLGEPVPRRTLYNWAKAGKITPVRFRRPDGMSWGQMRSSAADAAEYRLADVRRVRNDNAKVGVVQ